MTDRDVIVDATPALQRSDGFADLAEQMRWASREKGHEAADDVLIETLKRCALLAQPTHPDAASELEDIIGAWQHASRDWAWR